MPMNMHPIESLRSIVRPDISAEWCESRAARWHECGDAVDLYIALVRGGLTHRVNGIPS